MSIMLPAQATQLNVDHIATDAIRDSYHTPRTIAGEAAYANCVHE